MTVVVNRIASLAWPQVPPSKQDRKLLWADPAVTPAPVKTVLAPAMSGISVRFWPGQYRCDKKATGVPAISDAHGPVL